ncbi:MAG: UDP-glucose/GDP-mannose dehydrogenase family protein [Patescibacteria group bacterium]
MTITVVGHGYVGLVTACVLADFGNHVWVIGHTKEKIDRLKNGDPIIYEPGLKELLQKNIQAKRISFTLDYEKAIPESEIVFITVGTPPKEGGEADLTAVIEVARNIGKNLRSKFTVVSCKSTVPVGTNHKLEIIISKHKSKNVDFAVASCPEFLREGTGISDTINADRVVIGSNNKLAIQKLVKLHEPINGKRVITNLASAEMIKYASNVFLANKISFANLISFYCEKTGANVNEVLSGVGIDERIGKQFLNPGLGYGGSCLPKDVKAFLNIGKSLLLDTQLLSAIENINLRAQENFLEKIIKFSSGKKVAVWGLSFKPNTDDIRFAPSVFILEKLLEKGFQISAYDQEATDNIKKIFANKISYSKDPYQAINGVDALIIITEWNEFRQIDLNKVKKLMSDPTIFDGRNIYDPSELKKLGFKYYSIGRP